MTTEQQVEQQAEPQKKNENVFFTISYDANDDEYAKHRIDADQLVEIVTNMKELISRADKTINRRKETVKLYLQAPVQAGSLEIPFMLENLTVTADALEVLKYLGISAGAVVTKIVGGGVLEVLKKTKGKSILEIRSTSKSPEATIVLDGEELTVDKKVARLVTNPRVRENIQKLIAAPLEGKTESTFKVKLLEQILVDEVPAEQSDTVDFAESEEGVSTFIQDINPVDTISFDENDVAIFEKMELSPIPETHTEEIDTTIALTQISFTGSQKGWKMSYGSKTDVSVEILDKHFIQQINKDIASFRKGDLYNVILRVTTRTLAKRETVRYSIVKVKNHMASSGRKIVSDQPLKKEDE